MSTPIGNIRLPLHITISTLFIGIVVLLGILLSLHSYNKSSDIILTSAERLHEKISKEMQLDFKATYRPVAGSLQLLALSSVAAAGTRAARIENLPLLTAALSEVEAVSGIQLGYANGDYFIVRALRSDRVIRQFAAPPEAAYVVDNISESASSGRQLVRLFFDAALNLLQEAAPVATDYDPRQRPWYLDARPSPIAVQPYLFHFMREVGTTLAMNTRVRGVVIASDITLDQLSDTMAEHQITPNSEAVIIGGDGRVFAYRDKKRVIGTGVDNALGLAHIGSLGSPLL
ncbi:MAG: cache domain-containing protein, partial [Gammaproteobacteria bacterium]|nr:cache domain-containing protein [Gammaproteobacteria bacterium]